QELSEVQKQLAQGFGSQCGYCTPGFVVALTGLFERKRNESVTPKHIQNALTGNLCRCTGYVQILESASKVDPRLQIPMEEIYPTKALESILKPHSIHPIEIQTSDEFYSCPTDWQEALQILEKD